MKIQLSTLFFIISINFVEAFICPAVKGTYPHEWNKAAYYRCLSGCAYQENCPSNTYYSSSANKCQSGAADWNPRFDLTGKYQWPSTSNFMEIRQVGYDLQWSTEDIDVIYTFIGRYINETMVTGMQISLRKRDNCINLQDFELTVTGKRNFCRSRVAFHWYTRTCDLSLSPLICHVY